MKRRWYVGRERKVRISESMFIGSGIRRAAACPIARVTRAECREARLRVAAGFGRPDTTPAPVVRRRAPRRGRHGRGRRLTAALVA
jgi:hypothetical protein